MCVLHEESMSQNIKTSFLATSIIINRYNTRSDPMDFSPQLQ